MRQSVKSILVVADDDMVAAGVTATLVRGGYEVERKRHGPDVSARLSGPDGGLPDLLVIGIPAPTEGGIGVLRSLLGTLNERRRAIVLMDDATGEQEEELRGLGASALLPMETSSEEIRGAVRDAFRQG